MSGRRSRSRPRKGLSVAERQMALLGAKPALPTCDDAHRRMMVAGSRGELAGGEPERLL